MRTINSGMTTQEIYKTNPLTAVDMAHLSPSLLLKLLGEPNDVLSNDVEKKAYTERVQEILEEMVSKANISDRATKSIQIVDDILGMSSEDWERKYNRGSNEGPEMQMLKKFQEDLSLRAKKLMLKNSD